MFEQENMLKEAVNIVRKNIELKKVWLFSFLADIVLLILLDVRTNIQLVKKYVTNLPSSTRGTEFVLAFISRCVQ